MLLVEAENVVSYLQDKQYELIVGQPKPEIGSWSFGTSSYWPQNGSLLHHFSFGVVL